MPSIGVAIPCYNGHIKILKNLLDSIEKQTRKPDMVIISCSSSNDSDIPYKQEDYSFSFKIYTHTERKNAAQNRNIAASKLETDIISFIDADDQMHPQRLEIIEKAFTENNIVILLHDFIPNYDTSFSLYDINNIVFDISKLGINPWGYGARHLDENNIGGIHNSQSSVLKYITNSIQYDESHIHVGREDSVYTATIIQMFSEYTAYCCLPLSKYIGHASFNY